MDAATAGVVGAVASAAVTGVLGYVAAVVPARASAAQARRQAVAAEEANRLAQEELAQARAESDRAWLVKLDAMCRSEDAAERALGRRWLAVEVRRPQADPAVRSLLDALVAERLGGALEEAADGLRAGDEVDFLPPEAHHGIEEGRAHG